MSATSGLRVDQVTKRFGGTVALDRVGLVVGAGEVHALLGSNGSGKSTLVQVLAGVHQATSGGAITVGDRTVASTSISPADSAALGLRFVHQRLGLFSQLSIADNFAAVAGFGASSFGTIPRRELHRRTDEMLQQLRIDARPSDRVDRLRPSVQTLVAIGRAMVDRDEAKVLVLDEPTESLPEDETARLLGSVRQLAADGMTFVIVSHRLAEIAEVADAATILRDGRVVASAPMSELSRADLVSHITGNRGADLRHVERRVIGTEARIELDGVSVGSVRDLSMIVRPGEVVGLAGLVGSGRSAVLEGIFGARPLGSGRMLLDGRELRFAHPADAVAAGIALVPENRVGQGLFLDQPVTRNITAAGLRRFLSRGSIDAARERAHGRSRGDDLGIKTSSADAVISTLSGGNQQKAILARWLDTSPGLLLLDEPTQGVDVGARAEIHAIIRAAVAGGMSVVLVSSDLDELCDLSDRIHVLQRGRLTHTVGSDATVPRLAALMHEAA